MLYKHYTRTICTLEFGLFSVDILLPNSKVMGKLTLFERFRPLVKFLQLTGCLPIKTVENGWIEPIHLSKSIIGYLTWWIFSLGFTIFGIILTSQWIGVSFGEFTEAMFSFLTDSLTSQLVCAVNFSTPLFISVWSVVHSRLKVQTLIQLLMKLEKHSSHEANGTMIGWILFLFLGGSLVNTLAFVIFLSRTVDANIEHLVPFAVGYYFWALFEHLPILGYLIIFAQASSLMSQWIDSLVKELAINEKNYLKRVQELHENGLNTMNDTFSILAFNVIIHSLVGFTLSAYWIIDFTFQSKIEIIPKITFCFSLFIFGLMFLSLIVFLNYTSQNVSDRVSNLKRKILNSEIQDSDTLGGIDSRFRIMHLLDSFKGFEANGFFTLGKPLMTSLTANFLTYIVILVQFKISENT